MSMKAGARRKTVKKNWNDRMIKRGVDSGRFVK
jgi:hypothetical protein